MKPFEIITGKILEKLDAGVIPWKKPWRAGGMPRNLKSGKPYQGINAFMTLMQGYASPYWLTFNQIQERGGNVRKGEKGTPVVFWSQTTHNTQNEAGDIESKDIPFMRYYTVFNVQQTEGLHLEQEPAAFEPIMSCEEVINKMPQQPIIEHGFAQAAYSQQTDTVRMPPRGSFKDETGYYETLFHELAHATGHAKRLNRKGITEEHAIGTPTYCKEELIAELGASFLCGYTGIETATIENQAAYIDHWRKQLEADKRLIISAAAKAQKAADFILGRQHSETATEKRAA